MATVVAAATVVDAGLQGAAYRRTWVVLDERGETVTVTFSFPNGVDAAACYLAAASRELEAAEARDQATYQAAKDRAREPGRWPVGRPALPLAPGSLEYLEADARWTAHLAERTAGASQAGDDDLADLIAR
jgi:hypothetical protein